jgi:hypothetical protein
MVKALDCMVWRKMGGIEVVEEDEINYGHLLD